MLALQYVSTLGEFVGQIESGGKSGVGIVIGVEGSGEGGAIMSNLALLYTEGKEREMSSQGDVTANPATGGEGISTSLSWN